MIRPNRPHRAVPVAVALAAAALAAAPPARLSGQLRPLEPLDWSVLGAGGGSVQVGAGVYSGQRASLAGTDGVLVELGTFRAAWGLGRMALELSGTALWLFDERSSFAAPLTDVRAAPDRRRRDSGDYRISTIVQLTAPDPRKALALRFGVRLPTTDNVQGLGRDQMDFFSFLAGRLTRRRVQVGGELGLGINGTRDTRHEQVDPLLFSLAVRWGEGRVLGVFEVAGQHDTRPGPDRRGNEDLGEARLGMQTGGERWLGIYAVRGWTLGSPDLGLMVRVGARF